MSEWLWAWVLILGGLALYVAIDAISVAVVLYVFSRLNVGRREMRYVPLGIDLRLLAVGGRR